MKEAIWAALALIALTSRAGRPVTFVLLAVWFYSYTFVYLVDGEFGFQASMWLLAVAFLCCFLLVRSDGVTFATVAVTCLFAISFTSQLLFWLVPPVQQEFGLAFYFLSTTTFTLQLVSMAGDAIWRHYGAARRRHRRRAIGRTA